MLHTHAYKKHRTFPLCYIFYFNYLRKYVQKKEQKGIKDMKKAFYLKGNKIFCKAQDILFGN